jgi:hypothetical protein
VSSASKAETYRRYLLGDLNDEEKEEIEKDFFLDDECFGEMVGTEDDLIDAYLQQRLRPRDRQLFEQHFLAAEAGRLKLATTMVLAKAGAPSERKGGVTALAFAAALILVIINAGAWREIVVVKRQLQEFERRHAADVHTIDTLRKDLVKEMPRTASFALLPGLERTQGGGTLLLLPPDVDSLELWLTLRSNRFKQYSAALQSVEGRELWAERSLTSRSLEHRHAVVFQIPKQYLQPGTFVVELRASTPEGAAQIVDYFSLTLRRP